jgi:hypothetical protein
MSERVTVMAAKLQKQINRWGNSDIGSRFKMAREALHRGDKTTMQWHLDRAAELLGSLGKAVEF